MKTMLMKKKISLLAAASLLLLSFSSSCSKEEESSANGKPDVNEGEVSAGTSSSIITATCGDSGQGKAAFASSNGAFTWSDGDAIVLYNKSNAPIAGTLKSGAGARDGAFTAKLAQNARAGYAVYPHSAADGYDGYTLKIKYPSSYTIDNTKDGWQSYYESYSPTPMIATNKPNTPLEFHHVGGLFRIKIPSVPSGTASIKVAFPDCVTGTFSMSNPTPGTASVASTDLWTYNFTDKYRYRIVTYTFTEALESEVSNLTLNVPVPTNSYSAYSVCLYDSSGILRGLYSNFSNGTTVSLDIERAQGRKVNPKKVETEGFGGPFILYGAICFLSHGDLYLAAAGSNFASSTFGLYKDPFYSVMNNYGKDASEYATQYANTTGRSYFNWLELGSLFSTAAVSTSDRNNIDNLKVPTGIDSGLKVPTRDQWSAQLLVNVGRTGSTVNGEPSCRYAKVHVPDKVVVVNEEEIDCGNALVFFPDGVSITISESLTFNKEDVNWQNITSEDYHNLLAAGCVVLPATGTYDSSLSNWYSRGDFGYYWSSTADSGSEAHNLLFYYKSVNSVDNQYKSKYFIPVRLLRES